MGMARWDIIQAAIVATGARRYLEIGVQGGECFRRIRCEEKVGVDPDCSSAATVHLPSDTYFAQLAPHEQFDVVFVDGLHHREQVYRDIVNAHQVLRRDGVIVVHDCNPPTQGAGQRVICGGIWCGDVWQGWLDARLALRGTYTCTVDTDLGCGVVLSGVPPAPVPHYAEDQRTWERFVADRPQWLGLLDPADLPALWALREQHVGVR